jgi:hypothetical protein
MDKSITGVALRLTKGNYGKIKADMEQLKITLIGTPPRMFKSMLAGFNTIANHAYLLLFPVLLNLALWLGPKLRIKELLSPTIAQFSAEMLRLSPPDMVETIKASQTIWAQLLEQYNLATVVRTIPVGIPSLIARLSPIKSPLAWNPVIELPSLNWAVAATGIFLTIGFLLGSLFFYLISLETDSENPKFNIKDYLFTYVNSVVIFCLLLGVGILLAIPVFLILSVLSLLNATMAQVFILMAGFGLLWLLMPLVFSVHGVFVLKKKAMAAILVSIRLIRFYLPGTGLFVMTAALISELLNKLWVIPTADSWMLLLSIGGHSFVVAGLLAASFIYYRGGLRWMQDNAETIANLRKQAQMGGGKTIEQ